MMAPELNAAGPYILVVGDAMLDVWHTGTVPRQSPEAPVPVFVPQETVERAGGAANVAIISTTLGARTLFPLIMANDAAGQALERECERHSVVRSFAGSTSDVTTVKTRYVKTTGEHVMRVDRDATMMSSEEYLLMGLRTMLHVADAVILSDYRKGVFTPCVAQQIIEWANEEGVPTFVDSKRPHDPMWRGAFCFKHNNEEQGNLSPKKSLEVQRGQAILVTMGLQGAQLYLSEDREWHDAQCITSHELVKNAEVCGAGDAVVAKLAYEYARGVPLPGAAASANAYAGVYVGTPVQNRPPPPTDRFDAFTALFGCSGFLPDTVVGFTNGCFDLLHAGHEHLLRTARAECDILVVGLNSDLSVRRLKGAGRPVEPAAMRRQKIRAVVPDAIVVEFYHNPFTLIDVLRPDILFKGAEYELKDIIGLGKVPEIRRVPMLPGVSTTIKIADRAG